MWFLKHLFFHLFIAVLTAYFFNWLNSSFFQFLNTTENGLKGMSEDIKLVIILILGPIIETMIFQLFPLSFYRNLKQHFWIVFVACFCFALNHIYNPVYFTFAFFLSLNFNIFFIKIKKEKNIKFAVYLTIILHFLFNLYGYLFVV